MCQLRVVVATSGYTSLVGSVIDSIASTHRTSEQQESKHATHITLLTKAEAQQLESNHRNNPFVNVAFVPDDLVVLGKGGGTDRGGGPEVVVVLVNRANVLRLKAGLKLKFFHVTLSTPPDPDAEDYHTDLLGLFLEGVSTTATPLRTFDALAHHSFLRTEYQSSVSISLRAIRQYPSSPSPYLRIADASGRLEQFKLSMLSAARAYDLSRPSQHALRRYAVRQIGRASRYTDWGPSFSESERAQLDALEDDDKDLLSQHWSDKLKQRCLELADTLDPPTLSIESRDRVFVRVAGEEYRLQRFFRWIVPFRLAVSSTPRNERDVEVIASQSFGIRHILTLTEESPLPRAWFSDRRSSARPGGLSRPRHTFLPIADQRSPTVEQIQLFLRLAANIDEEPILVHCGGGKGRAGVMIASWLVAYGFGTPPSCWTYPPFAPQQAIDMLRRMRPGSIETEAQEEGVKRFFKRLSQDGHPVGPLLEEPTDFDPILEGKFTGADLLVLVGLPGSGKSHFRSALVARDQTWQTVSGDEDGGKSAILNAVSTLRPNCKLIVDRCNVTADSRRELLSLAQHARHPVAVYFSAPAELCLQRAQLRPNHVTLPPGFKVQAAIKQFSAQFVAPSLEEGFSCVATVSSIVSSTNLVRQLVPPPSLLKFPRTPHLLDLGAATPDDLLAQNTIQLRPGHLLIVTEKVDGANMGFSLYANRRIVVQNRSHYVESTAHPQFKNLDDWIDRHVAELQEVLGEDESFPERFILYGEWMAATHSVPYDRLPDLFLAFDLFDRSTSTFFPRHLLLRRLTRIQPVPELYRGELVPDTQRLAAMMEETSIFSTSERREGVYLKIENADRVVERTKVVRGDFIAGNEHWSKNRLRLNSVVVDETDRCI